MYLFKEIAEKLILFFGGRQENPDKVRAIKEWRKKFRGARDMIFSLDGDLKMYLYKDSFLSKLIYEGFEKDEVTFLERFLRDGDAFVDVGANIGYFSLYAAKNVGPNGRVYMLEPTPKVYKRLIRNLELNCFKNYTAFRLAVSSENKKMFFYVSKFEYDAWNSFAFSHNSASKKICVDSVTIDSLIEKGDISISGITLVKVDVEGWELPALMGMTRLLTLNNAPTFLVEFTEKNARVSGHSLQTIYSFMEGYGFKWYSFSSEENILLPELFSGDYPYTNLIATKNVDFVNARLNSEHA